MREFVVWRCVHSSQWVLPEQPFSGAGKMHSLLEVVALRVLICCSGTCVLLVCLDQHPQSDKLWMCTQLWWGPLPDWGGHLLWHRQGSHQTLQVKVMAAVETNPFTTASLINISTGQCADSTVKDNLTSVKVIRLKALSDSLSSEQKKTHIEKLNTFHTQNMKQKKSRGKSSAPGKSNEVTALLRMTDHCQWWRTGHCWLHRQPWMQWPPPSPLPGRWQYENQSKPSEDPERGNKSYKHPWSTSKWQKDSNSRWCYVCDSTMVFSQRWKIWNHCWAIQTPGTVNPVLSQLNRKRDTAHQNQPAYMKSVSSTQRVFPKGTRIELRPASLKREDVQEWLKSLTDTWRVAKVRAKHEDNLKTYWEKPAFAQCTVINLSLQCSK